MSNPWITSKVVLITGAASGLGAATALRLQAMGARLVLVDIDGERLAAHAATLGPSAVLPISADVRDLAAMQAVVAAAAERFGGIDVVWANAGIASFGPLGVTDPAAWVRTIEVNLIGAFNTVRAALPQVVPRRGHVVITASIASFVNGPCMSAYAATKAGVEAMGNSLRVELAHHGVTVGVIHPSWVATPMVLEGQALSAFRLLRSVLPAPLRREMTPEAAALSIAAGIAARHDRIYLPRFVGLLRWLRTPLHTRLGEHDVRRVMPELERAFVADVAVHGVAGASQAAQRPAALAGD